MDYQDITPPEAVDLVASREETQAAIPCRKMPILLGDSNIEYLLPMVERLPKPVSSEVLNLCVGCNPFRKPLSPKNMYIPLIIAAKLQL